jgi:hypothetical protein
LKQSSLEALDTIVTYHGSEDPSLDDGKLFSTVLAEVADLIADSDLHISDLSLYVFTYFQPSWPNCLC